MEAIDKTLELSAQYAALAQKHELVPICEPDIAFAGDFDEQRYRQVAERVWTLLFEVRHNSNFLLNING